MATPVSRRQMLLGLVLGCALPILATHWSSANPGAAAGTAGPYLGAKALSAQRPQQATASPTPAPADLQITWWRWDMWLHDGCAPSWNQWILAVDVTNAGGTAAGPSVAQDGQVMWQVPSLAPGTTFRLSEWGRYPQFPLRVDAYDQVPESNEGNNVVAPSTGTPWTATPRAPEGRLTPRPPRRAAPGAGPVAVMTAPVICPTRTGVPTLTPSGQPPLPDLEVETAVWDRLAVQMPGASGPCIPAGEPWRFEVTVRNSGNAEAGWFSVAGGAAVWQVPGLGAGRSLSLRSQPRFLPESLVVDAGDWVEESQEDNNTWSQPPGGTPTPLTRSLPFCEATPTSTATRPTYWPTPVPHVAYMPLLVQSMDRVAFPTLMTLTPSSRPTTTLTPTRSPTATPTATSSVAPSATRTPSPTAMVTESPTPTTTPSAAGPYLLLESWQHDERGLGCDMVFVDFPTYYFDAVTGELTVWTANPTLEPTDIGYVGTGSSLSGRGSGIGSRLWDFDALPFSVEPDLVLEQIDASGGVTVDRDGSTIQLEPGGEWTRTTVGESEWEPGCVMTTTLRITNYAFQDRRKIKYWSAQAGR